MFTEDQKKALSSPLNRSHVKARKQGGREVSYVEGWHAIAEANRIFGPDGWTRETIDLRCVSERDREIGKEKKPGFGVSYTAKVRVVVFAGDTLVIREGLGAGHGIDTDAGQAHESAIKEAETDAMKRALMTFGNPFGLALYDKEQANVVDEDSPKSKYLADCDATIKAATDHQALADWWKSDAEKQKRSFVSLSETEMNLLKGAVIAKCETLKKAAAA